MKHKHDEACVPYRETIESAWLDGETHIRDQAFPGPGMDLKSHLDSCPGCHDLAEELARWDRRLGSTLRPLGRSIPQPSEERIAATLRDVAEEDPDVKLLRRLRRPLRTVLWGTLFALVLLAGCVLAMMAYKALLGSP